jgi:hypothetical protein
MEKFQERLIPVDLDFLALAVDRGDDINLHVTERFLPLGEPQRFYPV